MAPRMSIKNVSLFNHLPDDVIAFVEESLHKRELAAGEILFNMNDKGDELIIVESGQIAIFIPSDDDAGEAIRYFNSGEVLGEMALMDDKPRSASARAEGDAVVWTLSKDDFQQLITENQAMSVAVIGGLSDRIRYTTDFVGELRKWMNRVADGDYGTEKFEKEGGGEFDESLSALAEDFVRMASAVKEREDALREELVQLRVVIDQSKRKQDVSEIAESDFFKNLREKKEQEKKKNS